MEKLKSSILILLTLVVCIKMFWSFQNYIALRTARERCNVAETFVIQDVNLTDMLLRARQNPQNKGKSLVSIPTAKWVYSKANGSYVENKFSAKVGDVTAFIVIDKVAAPRGFATELGIVARYPEFQCLDQINSPLKNLVLAR